MTESSGRSRSPFLARVAPDEDVKDCVRRLSLAVKVPGPTNTFARKPNPFGNRRRPFVVRVDEQIKPEKFGVAQRPIEDQLQRT